MKTAKTARRNRQSTRPGKSIKAAKEPSKHLFSAAREELTNITTWNFISSSSNVLEKILWALIAIGGTIFIYNVVDIQLDNWKDNPVLVTKVTKKRLASTSCDILSQRIAEIRTSGTFGKLH